MKFTLSILIIVIMLALLTGCNEKNITENYGVANVEYTDGGIKPASAEEVVPDSDTLANNLAEKGYEIEYQKTVGDTGIKAEKITAKKDGKFIDICYSLSEDDTQGVFNYYEKLYTEYYILAINGSYVYCVSDKDTFKAAGFTSTANFGTQFIAK